MQIQVAQEVQSVPCSVTSVQLCQSFVQCGQLFFIEHFVAVELQIVHRNAPGAGLLLHILGQLRQQLLDQGSGLRRVQQGADLHIKTEFLDFLRGGHQHVVVENVVQEAECHALPHCGFRVFRVVGIGDVADDLHRAVYESIYEKVKDAKMKNATKQADNKTETTETPKVEASASPIEGMKKAAEKFAKEKEAAAEAMGEVKKPQQKADDAAVEASNKKVNDLWNDLLKAGKEDLSASFIGLNARQLEVLPKLVSAMAENAYLRIKRGMHNLEDVVKEMRKEFAPAAQVFKKEDVDAIYEQMMNIRYRDGEQRMSLKEWADYYEKSSPKHQENLVGDSKEAEDRKVSEKKFIDAVKLQLAFGRKIKSIIELRKIAERHGLKDIKDTDLQELAETAIVKRIEEIET